MRIEVKSDIRRAGKIIGIAVIVLIVILFLLLVSTPIINNTIASNIEKTLVKTPLPDNTELCDSLYVAGKIKGNGNGMQFFGAILIKSSLSIDELDNYYAKYHYDEFSYIVAVQSDAEISKRVGAHKRITFPYLKNVDKYDNYYVVYTWGRSNYIFSDLDLRGH